VSGTSGLTAGERVANWHARSARSAPRPFHRGPTRRREPCARWWPVRCPTRAHPRHRTQPRRAATSSPRTRRRAAPPGPGADRAATWLAVARP